MLIIKFSYGDWLVLVSVCYTGSRHCGIRRGWGRGKNWLGTFLPPSTMKNRVARALQDITSFKKGQKDHQNELVYPLLQRGAKQPLPTVQVWQLPKRSPALLLRSKYNPTTSSFCHNQLMRGQCGKQPACFGYKHSKLNIKNWLFVKMYLLLKEARGLFT